MAWQDIRCGFPNCTQLADIVCTSLDGEHRGAGETLALCCRHFWDWNAKSLMLRSDRQPEADRQMREASRRIQQLVDNGFLDQAKTARGPEAIPLRMLL